MVYCALGWAPCIHPGTRGDVCSGGGRGEQTEEGLAVGAERRRRP